MLPRTPTSTLFPYTTLFRSRMLLVMIKRRANTFFTIVRRKVLRAAEVFVTTVKGWSQGKNINRKITLLIWQRSEEHTSELQSLRHLVCRLLLEKKKQDKENK